MSDTEQKIAIIVEAVNKFKGTFDELANSLKGVDEGTKRVQTSNSGMLQAMKENWIQISVAVYAVTKALGEAWELMEKGAKAQQAEDSFRSVAAAAGESADEILARMREAANGTVEDSDIMQKAVKGMAQGLSGEQLVNIMAAARVEARKTGEDVLQAYETITDAIANKMPRALLQYGLVTKEQTRLLSQAMAMGVTEVDLYAIAMENAANQSAKMGAAQENQAEKLQQLKAFWEEIKEKVGNAIWDLIAGIKGLAVGAVDVVIGLMSGAIAGIMGVFTAAQTLLNKIGLVSNETLAKTREEFEKLKNMSADYFKAAFGPSPKPASTGPSGGAPSGAHSASSGATQALRDIVYARSQIQTFEDDLTNLDSLEKTRQVDHVEAARERVAYEQQIVDLLQKQYNARDSEGKYLISDPNARANLLKQIDDAKKKMTDFRLALRELNGDFESGFQEGLMRYVDSVGSTFQQAVKLAQAAAQAMEQAFSDFFFDMMQGKLKSLADYIKNFLMSVERAMANMMAQQTAQGIAGAIAGFLNSPSQPATVTAHTGGLIMHQGGYVPRFHIGGLSSDEVPAILQKGEYVVSRKGVAALDKINNGDTGGGMSVVVSVENKSSQPVKASQGMTKFDGRSYIVGVVLEDLENNGPLRHALGAVK